MDAKQEDMSNELIGLCNKWTTKYDASTFDIMSVLEAVKLYKSITGFDFIIKKGEQ